MISIKTTRVLKALILDLGTWNKNQNVRLKELYWKCSHHFFDTTNGYWATSQYVQFWRWKSTSFHIVLALDPLIFITQEWNEYQCVRNFLLYNREDAYAALSLTVFELQQIKASQVDVKIATKNPFLSTSTECWHMLTTLNLLSNDTIAEYGSFWFQWFLNGEDPSNGLRATQQNV